VKGVDVAALQFHCDDVEGKVSNEAELQSVFVADEKGATAAAGS